MKPQNKSIATLLTIIFLLSGYKGFTQTAQKADLSIAVNYFISNNKVPRLMVKVKTKVNGRFQNVAGISLKLFLDKDTAGKFIGKVVTNDDGEATAYIPPSLKSQWGNSLKHIFVATFDGNKKYESANGDVTVAKAKILIDAGSDKTITASVFEMKDTSWVPVKGVDVVLAIRRMGADLAINDTPAFTTDSTGKASGDFKRDGIPGDAKGNIILVAKVLDNDQYGNLSVEKTVPWGAKFTMVNLFGKRTLFATRDKAPLWLQLIAYSIMFIVWGILVYLVFNVFKIKKIGEDITAGIKKQ
ncbi:hypothetical protein [Mucilaginibacter sp.]|uniref:hypothetical protein n=1 Tax=Mucilaginibacter sp. TaxID=1882438 RepID=UPI0026333800|nr:hypothetical protein [Mucilaginibacter sp.]MDB5031633.1 hypothetical protein [Mucilaginibacter sp.]